MRRPTLVPFRPNGSSGSRPWWAPVGTGLVGFLALSLVIPQAHAQDQAADAAAPALRVSFRVAPLAAPRHPALVAGGRLGPRVPAALLAAAWERRLLERLAPARALSPADTVPAAPALAQLAPPAEDRPRLFEAAGGGGGRLGPYADIGMQLNVRFELKADQLRNLRCTPQERQLAISGCTAGFPTISPNPQYAVRTAGVVGQRLRVNVDFDSEREFDANNNLQVWYEGLEDEILRRVEAGNVTFQTPPSRFISAAIPANNFGVQAIGQLGPLEFRGIYAQQKGNVIKDRFYTVGETTSQPLDREARDLDFEAGRFFFAVDPAALPGHPAVDILSLDPALLPDALRVVGLHVYRVRALSPLSSSNQNIGGVRAVACAVGARPVDCGVQRAGPFQWELLQEGKDYYVDPSGTWFALANRLDQSDYLAVSYLAGGGADSVGTFPVTANPDTAVIDTLRLVYDPRPGVTAAAAAFRFEIRNAYRAGGGEIARETVELALTVNDRERTVSTGETYLARLGLALETDPNTFDQYNRLFPRARDPQQGAPVRDYFVVLPHLTPFADSARLEPAERNDSLYRTPRPLLVSQGPPSVFTLRLHASVSASADRSTLSLHSFQIREGSEKIYLGNALLTRDVDYTIDYAVGQVQFRNPDSLFRSGSAQVRAQFEERAAFVVAPTTIYGLAARYDLGARGQVNLTGMFQREQSAFTRPPLGFEPASSFIGGISTELRFQPQWLTRAVDALPGVRTDAPSFLNVSAELAVSQPSPNQLGQAFVEEFESEAGRFLALADNAWHWGSVPSSPRGADAFDISPAGFDPANAAALTWQSLPVNPNGSPIQFLPQQIDPTIRIAGQAQSTEPVLWLLLKPDTVLGLAEVRTGNPNWVRAPQHAPRWRSITQTLSATGIDLTRVEFLEFWLWEDNHRVAKANRTAVLFDFGSVFEDAVAFVPTSFRVSAQGDTTYLGARLAGQGRFDTERDPVTRSWNAAINDEGILGDRVVDGILDETRGVVIDTLPLCSATENGQLVSYVFGDLRSRCGRRDGHVDTEDQDGDFVLDSVAGVRTTESLVRYVFPVGDDRFFVRDGVMTPVTDPVTKLPDGAAGWRLYRIPFRSDTIQVGQPSLRQVQALRLTIIAPITVAPGEPDPQVYFGIARLRLVGSSWLKRAETPIRGVAGDRGTGSGAVVASVVSTENRDLGYSPPPGVFDQADRRDADLQLGTAQINERSLRLLALGLGVGERAEAFLRFTTEGDKNFLRYKKLRVWARGRGPGWEDGDLEFYVKAGKDQNNFYLYHRPVRTSSWEPEVVVDFDRWLVLRGAIEQVWLRGDTAQVYPGCPDTTLVPHDSAFVMCDGPYLVHVRNPGTAPPNLASVQEIAAGILRVDSRVFVDQAELWVDDIRLSDVVQDVGMAGAVDVTLSAANVADLAVSLSRRDAHFRQLGEDPSYLTNDAASLAGTLRLERFVPEGWGLSAPLTVRYARTASDPFYLDRTDIRADVLRGLRTPRSTATSYGVSLRRVRRASARLLRWLVDPLAVSGSYAKGDARSSLSQATSSSYALSLDYGLAPGAATVRLGGVRLRVNPTSLRFRSSLVGSQASRFTYQVPVARPADALLTPAASRTKLWRNSGGVDLSPLGGLQLRLDVASQRDLRDYGDSTTLGRILRLERRTLLGQDVGTETQRTLNSFVAVTPQLVSWLRPRLTLASTFSLTRDPNARQPVREVGDTAGAFRLPAAFSNSRRLDVGTQVDPRRLGQGLFGDSAVVAKLLGRIATVDVSYGRVRTSSFDRVPFTPPLGYQLAFGGLERFRSEGGVLARSAVENTNFSAATSVTLFLGLRASANFQRTRGVSWALRTDRQVPIRTRSRDWPNGAVSWSVAPSRRHLGRVLANLTAQVSYRRRETGSEQPTGALGTAVTQSIERAVTPVVTLTWARGIVTSLDAAVVDGERLTAGNLFRTSRRNYNSLVTFAFRPPASLARLRSPIRSTARYAVSEHTTCLRSAGQSACVPYVDSRQSQYQLTLDTDFPPSLSAGFQMAYFVNEERQANRKVAQLVITAFVSLSASVGQLR